MKNLIEEINGNKLLSNSKISEDFKRGFNRGLDLSQEILNQYNIGELSDGYHTFNSLYEQRMYLFATIVNQNKDKAWKSYKHEDGELCFGGDWFIVGVDTPEGSYTYHYENKYWDLFECQELECGKKWDGHTDKDIDRMLSLNQYNIITVPKSVKLSEIVSRLNEIYEPNIYFNKELNAIGYGEYDKMWFMDTWTAIALIKNNKISKILKITSEETKWLYKLWIAGTEIIDDLKEDE